MRDVDKFINCELLSDFAIKSIKSLSNDKAKIELKNSINPLSRRLFFLFCFTYPVGFFGLIISLSTIKVFFDDVKNRYSTLYFFVILVCFSIFTLCVVASKGLQTRTRWRVLERYDAKIPMEAENILIELAEGNRRAFFVTRSGVGAPDALRTQDGQFVDKFISSNVFRSRFAPLLLINSASAWIYVLLNFNNPLSGINRPIYVETDPTEIESNESENASFKPHWIATITRDELNSRLPLVIERGKWEGPDAVRVKLMLTTAYEAALTAKTANQKLLIKGLARKCVEAISSKPMSLGLDDSESDEWIRRMLANRGDHPYKYVREILLSVTTANETV